MRKTKHDVQDKDSSFRRHHNSTTGDQVVMTTDTFDFATLGYGVEFRRTSLPNTEEDNMGVFTTRTFRTNELVTEYTGDRISREQALDRRSRNVSSYIKGISYHELIDGNRTPLVGQGIAQFTNDGTDARGGNNTKFAFKDDNTRCQTRVFLQAVRAIGANEEIFVSYGNGYWALDRPVYKGDLTTALVVDIKARMRLLKLEYRKLYQVEPEDKSDHWDVDFIVDASFDSEDRLRFIVQWDTPAHDEVSTVDAVDICHNVTLLKEFYKYVDPFNQAVLPRPPKKNKIVVPVQLPITVTGKVCSKCKVLKSTATEFRKCSARPGGYRGQCKACEPNK
jgi:hypothetical protein